MGGTLLVVSHLHVQGLAQGLPHTQELCDVCLPLCVFPCAETVPRPLRMLDKGSLTRPLAHPTRLSGTVTTNSYLLAPVLSAEHATQFALMLWLAQGRITNLSFWPCISLML